MIFAHRALRASYGLHFVRLTLCSWQVAVGADDSIDQSEYIEEMKPSWAERSHRLFQMIDTEKNCVISQMEFTQWVLANPKLAVVFLPNFDEADYADVEQESLPSAVMLFFAGQMFNLHGTFPDGFSDLSFNEAEFEQVYVSVMVNSVMHV